MVLEGHSYFLRDNEKKTVGTQAPFLILRPAPEETDLERKKMEGGARPPLRPRGPLSSCSSLLPWPPLVSSPWPWGIAPPSWRSISSRTPLRRRLPRCGRRGVDAAHSGPDTPIRAHTEVSLYRCPRLVYTPPDTGGGVGRVFHGVVLKTGTGVEDEKVVARTEGLFEGGRGRRNKTSISCIISFVLLK